MSYHYSLDDSSEGRIDFPKELNAQQYEAVTSPPGPALVIAGAGSGKTRTLTYRVAWLLEQGYSPGSILLLTFTNKAAKEMLHRVSELVSLDTSMIWGGTFHSFANRILRRHASLIGYSSSFSILDAEDQRGLLGRIIKAVLTGAPLSQNKTADNDESTTLAETDVVDAIMPAKTSKERRKSKTDKEKRFPKPEVLMSVNGLSANTGRTLEQILQKDFIHLLPQQREILRVLEEYGRAKRESDSMDFDDLLVNAVQLLRENEEVRLHYGNKFRQVLVDEYQDTNYIQDSLVDLLVRDHRNIMVVGDDAQSIYSWRGADMNHIMDFPKKYPDARLFKIETNYRSVPEILELSNAAIRSNSIQYEKKLVSSREPGDILPALVPTRTPSMQAKFVAKRILETIESGVEPREIAVLYRAHYQSLEIQMELVKQGIPFHITSGVRFFEQAHIKDVVSFLRFISNPRDEVAFGRLVGLVPGIGPATRSKLWQSWLTAAQQTNFALPKKFSEEWSHFPIPKKSAAFWIQLLYTLDELVPSSGSTLPEEMLKSILYGVYEEHIQASFDNYEQRKQDIEQLISYSRQFLDLTDLLSQLSLMSTTDQSETIENAVTLSTIHQAKGLEWHSVFVVWLADGMFPHQRSILEGDHKAMEEERRLFYVAVTRAKDKLYLSYPVLNSLSYSGDISLSPSRFLNEFPDSLVEEWIIS